MLRSSRRRARTATARRLYDSVVAQARRPGFYRDGGVPDSLDGRFEMVALHAFLVMRRLKTEGEAGAALSQALFDVMFDDMDRSLREMGAGDLGVGRRVKDMAKAFYGRIAAYDEGLGASDDDGLGAALARNLYGTAPDAAARCGTMAAYVRRVAADLAARPGAALLAGEIEFGPAPTFD